MKNIYVLSAAFLLVAAPVHAEGEWLHTATATGEAETKVAPDQATVNVNIYTEDKDLSAAKNSNDKKVKLLLDLSHEAGIKDDHIQTLYANVQPQYDYVSNRPVFRNYAVSNEVEVKLTNLKTLSGFMNTLVKNGFDRINNVSFSLLDETEKKVREDMLAKAVQNAQGKATKMAAAVNRQLGAAVFISDTGASINVQPYPMRRGMMMEKAMAAAPMAAGAEESSVPAGLITVHQNVSVAFELK